MEFSENINRLKDNITRLKHNYERLKAENLELFEEKQKLLEELKIKEEKIKELNKKIENIKITNALIISNTNNNNTEDLQKIKHSAKIKLNQIIKEIDKAIKILTTNELQS